MEEGDYFGVPNDVDQVQAFLPLISQEWFADYRKWKFVGQCIYNVLEDEGFEIFERYTIDEFKKQLNEVWGEYNLTNHGIMALRTLARKNNRANFREYINNTVKQAALDALQPTAGMTELADIVQFMFGDEFVCTDVTHAVWYQFRDNHWQQLNGGHILRQRFSRQLVPIFNNILRVISEQLYQIEDVDRDDPLVIAKNNCVKIIRGLKKQAFKKELMAECAEIFYNDDFEDLVDENKMLLGTKNGIYDFNIMALRPGFPEDCVSKQTGVPYLDDYHWEHPEVVQVMDFFNKMLHHQDLIDFTLGHKSTCLVGGNLDKWLVMYVGETAHNGKTTYEKLDKHTFGSYFKKLPLGVLVGKTPDAGAADPAMADTQGARLVEIDEANKKQKFNESFIKHRTGNDEFFARKLYSNGKMITPQFTIIMILNQAPGDLSSDAAIWERVVMIPFDTRYIANPPDTPEEQKKQRLYKADPFIEKRLIEIATAYLWVLIEYYKKRELDGGLVKPQAVLEKTMHYRISNDIYALFKEDKIEQAPQHKFVALDELYIRFKQWHSDAYPNTGCPNKQDFELEANRLLGESEGPSKKWRGWMMKTSVQRYDQNEG